MSQCAAAAHQLLFIMSGPKPTSAVHNFIVGIFFFLTCFWIECEMKTWRFLFKCFFLYKSRFCGFHLYVHYVQRFVSRDKTLRLQSYFFFFLLFGRGAQKHPPLCLIFVQYPSIWTISCCIKPEALPEAFNRPSLWGFYVFCSFIFSLHHWPLRVSDTGYC